MRYDPIVHGHIGIPQTLCALGLALLIFKPEFQARTKFRSPTIYVLGILVLIVGLLGWFVIPRV